jgi:hypothetical protein
LSLLSDFDDGTQFNNRTGTKTQLSLEGLAAPGDSGGGVFVAVGGTEYLAGVNSFLTSLDGDIDSSYGDISGCTSVSPYLSWIQATTIPEPSPAAMLVGMAIAWLAGRRRL